MTEKSRPTEAEQTQSESIRIFSGARVKNGKLENQIHQALYDLWSHEYAYGRVPGTLRTITVAGSDVETTRSLRVYPKSRAAEKIIEDIRSHFEQGVKRWVEEGSPPYDNVSLFREAYITPLDREDHDF